MSENIDMSASKVIVFELANEEYVVPVEIVRSIEKVQSITRVPRAAEFVKGVMNLRGIIIPIIDLRLRFGIAETKHTNRTRIIIITQNDYEVGLVVDAATDVMDIPAHAVEKQPEIVGATDVEYIEGVANVNNRLLILLNVEKVLELEQPKEKVYR